MLTVLGIQLDQQEEDADPDIVRKSRDKKRKSQPDDSDEEMQDARPTKKTRPSVLKKQKEKAEEDDLSMANGEGVKPPRKEAVTSESKPTSTVGGKKKEPASPPKTPVNKKSEKPRKRRVDPDEESEDGKRASTPSVLKVRLKIVIFARVCVLTMSVWQNGSRTQDKNAESAPNREETLAEVAKVCQLCEDIETRI